MKTRQFVCWLLCAASPALAQVSPWTSGTYGYDGAGNLKAIGADYYVYDPAGRLVRGSADKERTGVDSYQAYTYDAFGNRLTATTTGTQCVNGCGVNIQVNNANRVTDHSATYYADGNLKHFDTSYYSYDGAGMLVTISSSPTSADAEYIYTADDERLAIYTGGGNWRFTIRDLDAKVVREVTAFQSGGTTTWTWHRDHVFRDGLLVATILPEGVQHYHLDHLGTPRLVTDGSGHKLGVHVYYPFGDELNLGLAEQLSPERLKYTGHERDISNGTSLDDMHARYYNAAGGRFLSVDPTWDSADLSRPQAWNRYAYVRNNPIGNTDPTGKVTTCNKESCTTTADTFSQAHSTGQTTVATPEMQAAATAGADKVAVPIGPWEKLGFGVRDATGTLTVEASAGVDASSATARITVPAAAEFGIHGHIDHGTNGAHASDGMVDDPEKNHGYGDTQSLSLQRPMPMATVSHGQVGWHEIQNGQLIFTAPVGAVTAAQRIKIQNNLNSEQELPAFWRP